MLDLNAYFARIGLQGNPSVRAVHRAHVTSIPFENLDPRGGRPVSLAAEDVERKLVAARRGGYCFEHNLLLKDALEALGAEVDVMLARVRFGRPAGRISPRSHAVLRVREGGAEWHADVGFGPSGLLEPLPFGPGGEHVQSGWRFRVVAEGPLLVLQTVDGDAWIDAYAFPPEPVPFIDLETSNWYTSTYPRSPFVTGLVASLYSADGARTILSDWSGELSLSEQTPAERTVTPVGWEQVPELLAERFGLRAP
jgi:N-hydroxyarylamine O-acetyltransferase